MRSSFALSVNLPARDLTDEDMLRIMSNENVESMEERTVYQCDTVLAVRQFLENGGCPTVGQPRPGKRTDLGENHIGARQISAFLGKENWSKSKVADLLKLNNCLPDEIKGELR